MSIFEIKNQSGRLPMLLDNLFHANTKFFLSAMLAKALKHPNAGVRFLNPIPTSVTMVQRLPGLDDLLEAALRLMAKSHGFNYETPAIEKYHLGGKGSVGTKYWFEYDGEDYVTEYVPGDNTMTIAYADED